MSGLSQTGILQQESHFHYFLTGDLDTKGIYKQEFLVSILGAQHRGRVFGKRKGSVAHRHCTREERVVHAGWVIAYTLHPSIKCTDCY